MSRGAVPSLRAQALSIGQNVLSDATPAEIGRWVDALGEEHLLQVIQDGARATDVDVVIPVSLRLGASALYTLDAAHAVADVALTPDAQSLYMLSNISLGNERIRQAVVARIEIVEALSSALVSCQPPPSPPPSF
jgi:hypothetical protein